ncbi:MAG TPA: thiol peroxidase [Flavobacterium sp.]|jgi:thiol peroxidase
MALVQLGGNPVTTNGQLPATGSPAPGFTLIKNDLSEISLKEFQGTRLVMNIFPSIDTSTCATSVRKFNQQASALQNTKILCISRDLPFAQKRFCGAEGIENVLTLSDFRDGKFGKDYGIEMLAGKLKGLHARAVVVTDENGIVIYSELVQNISDEPNYAAALAVL